MKRIEIYWFNKHIITRYTDSFGSFKKILSKILLFKVVINDYNLNIDNIENIKKSKRKRKHIFI